MYSAQALLHRFNLLREESEGYAKLITALCQSSSSTPVNHLVRVTAY